MNEGFSELAPALDRLLNATASVEGDHFFEALVVTLAEVAGVRCAFLSEALSQESARFLCLAEGGALRPTFMYALAGTPCQHVLRSGPLVQACDAGASFPTDERLRRWDVQAYVGVPIPGPSGGSSGLLAVMHSAAIEQPSIVALLLRTLAVRTAAEMQRVQLARALQQQTRLAEASSAISAALNDFSRGRRTGLQRACDLLRDALELSAVCIVLLDTHSKGFELAAHAGLDYQRVERYLPELRERFLQYAPRFHPVLVIPDLQALQDSVERSLYQALDMQSAASALIGSRDEPSGLLSVISLGERHHFDAAETNFVRIIADRVSQAVDAARLHEVISASEQRYRHIVATCLEGVWTVDEQGNTTFVNRQMAAMLGYEPEEMLGRPLYDFMDDAGRHQAAVNLERRRAGIRERHEFRFKKRDGTELWTILSTTPLSDDLGRYVGALALATDVTERRGLELKIQQAQKLESLGVLAGGVAHDFNNLLVGMLGNVGLALLELPPEAPVIPLLEDIKIAAMRAAELTKQMLAYSGKGRFVVQRLNLTRLVEEMTHLLTTAVSRKAALRLNLAPNLPDIDADAAQIRQVLMNLITNASDALEDSTGTISVTTGFLNADRRYLQNTYLDEALPGGKYAYIEVSDTGAGMRRELVDRIFDPFYTTKFTGRGLGLAAVLGILRGHRGAIKVYSEPGSGSTFKVLLPVAEQSSVAEPPTLRRAAFTGVGTVLIADDEESVRKVAERVLRQSGFRVLMASNGSEAVRMYAEHADEVVAVLLDMTMPKLSGEEVFRELRRLRPDVRVVLSSGYNEQDAMAHFVGKGLAGFLQKPWVPAELIEAMRKALDGSALVQLP